MKVVKTKTQTLPYILSDIPMSSEEFKNINKCIEDCFSSLGSVKVEEKRLEGEKINYVMKYIKWKITLPSSIKINKGKDYIWDLKEIVIKIHKKQNNKFLILFWTDGHYHQYRKKLSKEVYKGYEGPYSKISDCNFQEIEEKIKIWKEKVLN